MTTRQPDAYNDSIADAWGTAQGLHRVERGIQPERPLRFLVDQRPSGMTERIDALTEHYHDLFDHPRAYAQRGKSKVVVVVTAPYLGVIRRKLGSLAALNRFAYDVARDLGLYVRVGHPSDAIYVTANEWEPTIPVVWWNPEKYDIFVPEIEDPYERLISAL